MAKIKGKWRWHNDVAIPSVILAEDISFVSDGRKFIRISVEPNIFTGGTIIYAENDEISEIVAIGSGNKDTITVFENHINIDFGETEQEVSEEFYNYLIANAAVPISEKLTRIAENEQKVYDAGIEEGKKSEYDLFWDTFQQKGTRTAYERAFAEAGSGTLWQVGTTYRPKYPIAPTRADDMYYATRLPYEALKEVDFSQCTNFYSTFAYASTPHLGVIDARRATRTNLAFAYSNALTAIDKFIVAETTPFVNTFVGCKNLTNIVVEGTIGQNGLDFKDCKNLSRESIESVIYHLSGNTTGKTVTFPKAAVDKAFETSEGAADGETSAEWIALRGTKPNWTFTLS